MLSLPRELEVNDATPPRALSIDQILIGDTIVQNVVFDDEANLAFLCLARDRAPVHEDDQFARGQGFEGRIIQGLAVISRFSRLLGMYLPGERAVLEKVEFKFHHPVYAGRELIYTCAVKRIVRALRVVSLEVSVDCDAVRRVSGQCQCLIL